jgi:nicotinate-nucleotide pyrophosphorylase (carboxylating)
MISEAQFKKRVTDTYFKCYPRRRGDGDHSSMACIQIQRKESKIISKDDGIIAGVEFAKMIFHYIDLFNDRHFIVDGMPVKYGDVVFHVSGSSQSI